MVDFASGCASHALHNVCEGIAKTEAVKESIRCSIFVATSIKNNKDLQRIYKTLSTEMLRREYAVLLYSSSRWGSIYNMLTRLIQIENVVRAMGTVITIERASDGIQESTAIPNEFARLSSDPGFWERVHHAKAIFGPIYSAIRALESNCATMASAYACFLMVRMHIEFSFEGSDRTFLTDQLLRQWERIWTPVHTLAFHCDPCFRGLREAVVGRLGHEAVGLGQEDFYGQCRKAIAILCRRDGSANEILDNYLQYCLDEERLVTSSWSGLTDAHPRKVWTQGVALYPALSKKLLKVYSAPASTAAVERNHKLMKRINFKRRCTTGDGKAEVQIAVALNSSVGTVETVTQRQDFERRGISNLIVNAGRVDEMNPIGSGDSQPPDDVDYASDPLLDDITDHEALEQAAVCAELRSIAQSSQIPDFTLFAEGTSDIGDR